MDHLGILSARLQQDSIQELQNSFRSDQIVYFILINKSKGFSQSLSSVPTGGDMIRENQISGGGNILRLSLSVSTCDI